MEERLRNKLLKMQADLHHAIKTLEESKTFKITFHTARENIRDYLGHIEGNEINLGHESIDSTDKLYEGQVYPFVIALIPAHNEELRIENTLNSLLKQTRPPDEIIVIADNCTDNTIAISLAMGVNVIQTHDNKEMKAGALNSVLDQILPMLDETDSILVMDADTILSSNFIRSAMHVLFAPLKEGQKSVAGVGGIFLPLKEKWSLAAQLQTNEYIRYQRRLSRRRGRALVLTGTGTMFNIRTLRGIVEGRRIGIFPNKGNKISVYDTAALTEDNELTLCAKRLNYRVLSPKDCTVQTAMMPTFKSLYKQRRRWQRGALENIYSHGLDAHTMPYFIRQIITYLGVGFVILYSIALTNALVENQYIDWKKPIWLVVAGTYVFEQTFSVRKGGWPAILTSLLIIPEIIYNLFLDLIYIISFQALLFGVSESWGRMRDSSNIKTSENLKESHNGKIEMRKTIRGRVIEIFIEIVLLSIGIFAFSLPFWNPQISWLLIAIYVLIGFAATLARLVPVKIA